MMKRLTQIGIALIFLSLAAGALPMVHDRDPVLPVYGAMLGSIALMVSMAPSFKEASARPSVLWTPHATLPPDVAPEARRAMEPVPLVPMERMGIGLIGIAGTLLAMTGPILRETQILMFAGIALLMIPAYFFGRRRVARVPRLVREGEAAIGKVLSVTGPRVRYTFPVGSSDVTGTFDHQSNVSTPPAPGLEFVVLYDRRRPETSVPWPIARTWFKPPALSVTRGR